MSDMVKLTGLWKYTDKDGNEYLSGKINPDCVLNIFPNQFKTKPTHPDYVAYLAQAKKKKGKSEDA